MDYNVIKEALLTKHKEVKVVNYINYLKNLETAKKSDKTLQNPWFKYKDVNYCIDCFNKIADEGLVIDGETISIQSRGISLNYQAYKNLVLIRYPETKFDVQLVKDDDEFSFQKKDGKVFYSHKIGSPFVDKKVVGAYCVIKNKLGEFIETISLLELQQIRKTAKTDYIWKEWTNEMYLKTIIKRACKRHFRDITINIDVTDNIDNYDITNPLDIDIQIKQEIEDTSTLEQLKEYFHKHKENTPFPKSFNHLIAKRKKELEALEPKTEEIA